MSNEKVYEELIEYENRLHMQNLKRIKTGLWLVLIIPLVFMILLFLTESNKVVFLFLWIASLFLLSAYLVLIEYTDYKIQNTIKKLTDRQTEVKSVLETDLSNKERRFKQVKQSIVSTLTDAITLDDETTDEEDE